MAVAKAAMDSGVARKPIEDWREYRQSLRELMGQETKFTQNLYDTARSNPKRVVFAEGTHPTMLEAAVRAKEEGFCHPILLGNDVQIRHIAEDLKLQPRRYRNSEPAQRFAKRTPPPLRTPFCTENGA